MSAWPACIGVVGQANEWLKELGRGLVVLAANWVDIGRKIGYRPIGRLAIIAEEKPIQLVNQLA